MRFVVQAKSDVRQADRARWRHRRVSPDFWWRRAGGLHLRLGNWSGQLPALHRESRQRDLESAEAVLV
jgi:hypothetical protein